MTYCTYYDLLGVSRHATTKEITEAKIFLIKKFHPDANMGETFDTTLYIQKVLEAYNILSDSDLRKRYDHKISNVKQRYKAARTYSEEQEDYYQKHPSFAPYWEAANKLNEVVQESMVLFKKQKRSNKLFLNNHFLNKTKQAETHVSEIKTYEDTLTELSCSVTPCIAVLAESGIPREYWVSSAMNWLLFQWTQNRDLDFHLLCPMYDTYLQTCKSDTQRTKLSNQSKVFLANLEKLLAKQMTE
ncbi:MAG: DnaJ domain-containing protein [Lachnospiraceae bacterium]